ncbi:c-type cytochrome biogenesis protein CcsB [Leeia sp. TBRC 13508]|uniref:C-type cytochrome biogenesis protein CcsB n=1 Tax=Leeia speluncae TaxID=2884804 RepID=A0ABS8D5F6_9NEIS|nr:c-type cytochrome biogenesis protein CcsB [Leeia speluncae]MCB6183435.1 c-type cytochrome biogenesis protein CcsB [Leeia speluncae]
MELANQQTISTQEKWFKPNLFDILFALFVIGGAAFAFHKFADFMDIYEKGILIGATPCIIALGWYWQATRTLMVSMTALSLFAIQLYDGSLANADTKFILKYWLSSQSAIMWMGVLYVFALFIGWLGLFRQSTFLGNFAKFLVWAGTCFGFTGMFVRWYASYLLGQDVGHIPVSNLYEVFVLFCLIAALVALFYSERYESQQLIPFALVVINAAVVFTVWYTVSRGAQQIQPLIPALQSYWMKIHVPANFVGYGGFAFAAMIGVAQLLTQTKMAKFLPPSTLLDEVMYKAIAIGFFFFTIATILGALWAAEAWGGYWSWDPKETWALIVWLNYAAWLHLRLIKGLRGMALAWWAVGGLLVTTFAFLGVNMWLSGMHSYGGL